MELKEINVPEGIVLQIDHEGQFAGITVDVGKGNNIYSNVKAEEINKERARYLQNTDEMLEEWHSCTQA
ncbi:MAG TPA: hypothetical protein VKL21_06980 [Candidatus Methanoperedens sp.]|nr:hypothetical protein [Candidatus Methanoperedens sp.]